MVNNEQKDYEKNDNPQQFQNVKVYASDNLYAAADAEIKNFEVCQIDSGVYP